MRVRATVFAAGMAVFSACGDASTMTTDAGSSDDAAAHDLADAASPSDAGMAALPDAALPDAAPMTDAAPPSDAAAPGDAALGPLTTCPTSGAGALRPLPGSACFRLTPAETGANPAGANATEPSYAVRAASGVAARNQLVLYLNGSGAHPSSGIATPSVNFFNSAASLGYDVLAISYSSEQTIGSQCATVDSCYFPTRQSVVLGVVEPGASATMSGITLDEGIADRVVLALRYLDARDPGGRWRSYLTSASSSSAPETQIAWDRFVSVGSSQGGGHATTIGKLFTVARVIQLSSTCDATTTDGVTAEPASWTSASNGPWATDPSQFWGLDIATTFDATGHPNGGDVICAYHLANWQNLGMLASHRLDDAATCGATTDLTIHGASSRCTDNEAAWLTMLR